MENNRKALVIDDEAHIRRVLELKLKNQGYQVLLAKDGEEGLNIIKTQKPSVVITDIMMPRMDGKTLCAHANQLKKERPFLTIIMTCRISPNEQDWIDQMQDTLFMEKPFSPSKLMESINQFFEARK